jgi:hypothetical protein
MQRAVDLALRRAGFDPEHVRVRVDRAPRSSGPRAITVNAEVRDAETARALGVAAALLGDVATAREAWHPSPEGPAVEEHWSIDGRQLELPVSDN